MSVRVRAIDLAALEDVARAAMVRECVCAANLADETEYELCPIHDDVDTAFDPPTVLALIERLQVAEAKVARSLALAEKWAEQATDYDEDTEQQIADGHTLRAALAREDPLADWDKVENEEPIGTVDGIAIYASEEAAR